MAKRSTPQSQPEADKPYWEMTTEELREATKEFDDPNYHPPVVPIPVEELEKLKRAMQKRGKPQSGGP
jgi:hypothetical protein